MPNVILLAGGAFGRWLCHKGGTLMNRISACMKETPESSFALSHVRGHRMNLTVYEPRSTYSPDTKSSILYILDLAFRSMRNTYLLCKPPSLLNFYL